MANRKHTIGDGLGRVAGEGTPRRFADAGGMALLALAVALAVPASMGLARRLASPLGDGVDAGLVASFADSAAASLGLVRAPGGAAPAVPSADTLSAGEGGSL